MVFQQGDTLSHTLDALWLQLFLTGCDRMKHMFHICIIKHRTMHYTATWQMIKSRAAHFSISNHHIVVSGACCFNTHPPQHQQQHVDKAIKGESHILFLRHKRQHNVASICIHTTTTTLAPIHLNAMCSTVIHINLTFHQLVASEDNRWLHLPHKEQIVIISHMASDILLHSKIKWQSSIRLILQDNILHCWQIIGYDLLANLWNKYVTAKKIRLSFWNMNEYL